MKTLKIHKPILVAHCFGGFIASLFASRHAKLLRGLILIDTGYTLPDFTNKIFAHPYFLKILTFLKNHISSRHIHEGRNYDNFVQSGDWNIQRIASDVVHTSIKTYLEIFPQMASFEGRKFQENIHVPTHILVGDDDSIFPKEVSLQIHDFINDSTFEIIRDANHMLILSKPREISEEIKKFSLKLDIIEK